MDNEKKEQTKDIVASIRARLRNIAKQSGRDVDAVLLQYFQERFLYRMSISEFSEKFILKGALLLLVNNIDRFRPTKDIDLLGRRITSDLDSITRAMKKIGTIEYDDGVACLSESLQAHIIKEGAQYEGVRIKIDLTLGNIRKRLTVDIGFGDAMIDEPVKLEFPVLLDMPSPKLQCYHLETIIAEKFQAIVWLNFQTSRMKDIFDILFLAQTGTFKASRLRQAIELTFRQRNTGIEQRSVVFSGEFKHDPLKQTQWTAFLRKHRLQVEPVFSTVVDVLEHFLEPLFDTRLRDKSYIWSRMDWGNGTDCS